MNNDQGLLSKNNNNDLAMKQKVAGGLGRVIFAEQL